MIDQHDGRAIRFRQGEDGAPEVDETAWPPVIYVSLELLRQARAGRWIDFDEVLGVLTLRVRNGLAVYRRTPSPYGDARFELEHGRIGGAA